MPGSTTYVTKSAGILMLDTHLRKPSRDLIDHIKRTPSIFSLLMSHGIASTQDERHHIKHHIAAEGTPSDRWWKDVPEQERSDVLRAAYIKAIELSTASTPPNDPKPIVTYHVKGIDDPRAFDVVLFETDFEIHVMWITPKPRASASKPAASGQPPYRPTSAPEEADVTEEEIPGGLEPQKMWLIANPQRIRDVRARFDRNNPGRMKEKYVDPSIRGAMILQVSNY